MEYLARLVFVFTSRIMCIQQCSLSSAFARVSLVIFLEKKQGDSKFCMLDTLDCYWQDMVGMVLVYNREKRKKKEKIIVVYPKIKSVIIWPYTFTQITTAYSNQEAPRTCIHTYIHNLNKHNNNKLP